MSSTGQSKFPDQVQLGQGWEVSIIPTGTIEEAGAFIDRMRGD